MFIQVSETPNPQTMKFIPGVVVMPSGKSASFSKTDEVSFKNSPLAKALLEISEIEGVFFGDTFISITKIEKASWLPLKTLVIAHIMDYLMSGKAIWVDMQIDQTPSGDVINSVKKPHEKQQSHLSVPQDQITAQIIELIDTRVRPAVAEDGGDIEFDSFDNGVVYVRLRGACSGCPSSVYTLKNGIENMLKYYVPEVQEVREVGD